MPLIKKLIFKIQKIFNYEYWPYTVFYFPAFCFGIFLATISRSLMYFSSCNPAFKYGGVMGISKSSVLDMIPEKHLPKTTCINVTQHLTAKELMHVLEKKGLNFPLIMKPDIGERGKHVEKIDSFSQLLQRIFQFPNHKIIIQEYINLPLEFGILYYRYPNSPKGHISSMVKKEFLTITGDGKNSIKHFLEHHIRSYNRIDYYCDKFGDRINTIPEKGNKILIEPIGNHCRGTTFLNANNLITSDLEEIFDSISIPIPGFYYGRFDLKVNSIEELYQGKNIKIMELNGVSSEPAHIYDPSMSFINAYKEIIKHMIIIYKISSLNHKKGFSRDSLFHFIRDLYHHRKI